MKKLMTRLLSLALICAFVPSFVLAAEWDLKDGNITVNAAPGTDQTVSQAGSTPKVDTNPVITSSGTTNNTVTIEAGKNATANVTLDNVNIDVSSDSKAAITTKGDGNVTIELEGTNTVQSGSNHAGVEKDNTGTLTITDKDNDGRLTANGGSSGAGIGGGYGKDGTDITISGGKVKANGGVLGAGIGGGYGGDGKKITVSGGEVTANGSNDGAGIGGGENGDGSIIIIENSKVTANGGTYGGAGIGGGYRGDGSTIIIKNSTVTAKGGQHGGAGIGGGIEGAGTDIKVFGGDVNATGGSSCAGIGGGLRGNGSIINIENGTVTATGGEAGAGIGGGMGGDGTDIKISGGTVTANGGPRGAGIGGGFEGDGTGIAVSGGEVNATGSKSGAGIGGGAKGTGTGITVSNDAQVKVQGGEKYNDYYGTGAGIGDGGTLGQDGKELLQDPGKLNGGTIRYYAPGANMQTDAPTLIVGIPKGNTAETAVEVRQEAYWVCGSDGQALTYQSQVKDGVLTVTVQADTASLRGTTGSLRQLEAQGITEIRFVTNQAQSDFALSDLLTSGTGSVTLTHDGDKVTFTLESTDISGILK